LAAEPSGAARAFGGAVGVSRGEPLEGWRQQQGRCRAHRVSCSLVTADAEDGPQSAASVSDGSSSVANGADQGVVEGVGGSGADERTEFVAETQLPTERGFYRTRAYKHYVNGAETLEPMAIIIGEVEGQAEVPVRVHDACFTSEVLGSLKCDCKQQLELALEYIRENGIGMVIYLQQEGRGIGLANKIAAYALQEDGLDTVDANRALGLPDDSREYSAVRHILEDLNVESVSLMTNNPRKIDRLTDLGVDVVSRIPCVVTPNLFNQDYLDTKERRMRHFLEGGSCEWGHDTPDRAVDDEPPSERGRPQL